MSERGSSERAPVSSGALRSSRKDSKRLPPSSPPARTIELTARGNYELRAVVFSHGWADLFPFHVEDNEGAVRFALRDRERIFSVRVSGATNGVKVDGEQLTETAIASVRWMFRLDDPLEPFYQLAQEHERPWIEERKMGRLLRSQSVFEDLIKLILTTNCSWGFTRVMVERLVNNMGDRCEGGHQLFPTPEAFAKKSESFYREKIRAGYRSPHLRTIGKAVSSGALNVELWRDSSLSTEEVRKEILAIPGAGPYVADNLLRFLGRYDRLGLDSWAREKIKEIWNAKKQPTDKAIERHYAKFGSFKGLLLWCDLTRDWFEGGDFASWIRLPEQETSP